MMHTRTNSELLPPLAKWLGQQSVEVRVKCQSKLKNCGELTWRPAVHTEQSVNHVSGMDQSMNYVSGPFLAPF